MRKNGKEAIMWMRVMRKENLGGFKGWCLRTARYAWELPADQPSAIKEWESIPAKYKSTKWWKAPIGAPHFWAGGEFGHVALQSAFKGFVWGTDAPNVDKVGRVHMSYFSRKWGYEYLGWSSQFQNVKLPLDK